MRRCFWCTDLFRSTISVMRYGFNQFHKILRYLSFLIITMQYRPISQQEYLWWYNEETSSNKGKVHVIYLLNIWEKNEFWTGYSFNMTNHTGQFELICKKIWKMDSKSFGNEDNFIFGYSTERLTRSMLGILVLLFLT